jgi:RNA polymerase sigma factor (sigma-70 family)
LKTKEYNCIVEDQTKSLFRFVAKYLRNEEDARDIVQDVFEKLWLNREKIVIATAKSWLFTTAYHALINFSVKKRRTEYTDKPLPETVYFDTKADAKEIVELALAILPPLQKSIILLRDLEGYDYKEIGKILTLSEPQVKVYLFRARMKMKKRVLQLTELA